MVPIKVFVYGTLKRGYVNHLRCLYNREGVKLLGLAETVDKMTMYDLGSYPFVVKNGKGRSTIKGEVYEITPEVFKDLDFLEGYPENGYDRIVIPVLMEDGTESEAWIYVIPVTVTEQARLTYRTPIVKSGLWRNGEVDVQNMEAAFRYIPTLYRRNAVVV